MNAEIEPATAAERIADDMTVKRKAGVGALRARLQHVEPELMDFLESGETLFSYWKRYKVIEQELAESERKLQEVRKSLTQEHRTRLKDLMVALREMESEGLLRVGYRHKVKRGDLRKALKSLGVRSGDTIFVHSSLSGLGYVEGGIEQAISELAASVGKSGTLAMPVFSQNYMGMIEEPYDERKSVSTVGQITDAFWRRPGVLRSDNPCHSIAALGPKAEYLVAPTGNWEMFDRKGTFGRLYDINSWIIFLGCSLGANTTLHAVEAWALPYLPPMILYASDGKGGKKKVVCRQFPNWCREWYGKGEKGKIQQRLSERGVISQREVGRGKIYAMRARVLVEACLQILKKEPDVFLCENHQCVTCPGCRAMLAGWEVPDTV